ncbi:MAG: hypothetical protein NTY76_04555 [Candidatus Omnitrophica bacterium]|nr:hypothetical protein [Candidatus Omnitrophota bacterium]
MRHIRTRRRYKVILILLCIICFTVFVENRVEDLIPQLKSLAEAKVEDALGGKASFSIGSIDGGIIHPIVLNDIRIKRMDASQFAQSFAIDSIRTNYYIKDVIRAVSGSELSPLLDKNSTTYVKFSVKNGDVKGFVGLHGDLSDSRIDGYLTLFHDDRINFSGYIKNGKFYAEIKPGRPGMGSVRAFGTISADSTFIVNFKFDHLKVSGFDIACDAVLKNEFIKNSDTNALDRIEGEFEAHNLILNFKPFIDIKTSYKIMRDSVEVTDLSLGEVFKAYGKISLKNPRDMELTLLANNVSLSWLMLTFGKKEATSALTGTMSGKFELKGPLRKVKVTSHFDIKGGTIGGLNFDYMTATLNGELPFLKIEDSRITRNSGYFALAGELDLRRLGKDNMFDNVKLVTDDTAITWDEWNSTKNKDGQELNMKKNLVGHFGFGYKKFVKEDKIDESLRDSDEVHFDYNLQANDSIKVTVGQDKDFFGFEHKDKF